MSCYEDDEGMGVYGRESGSLTSRHKEHSTSFYKNFMCECVSSYFPPEIPVRIFLRFDVIEVWPCLVESDKLIDFFLTPPKRAHCHYVVDRGKTLVTSR